MPIIASAKKRMRQNEKRRVRNHAYSSMMRSLVKNVLKYAKGGEKEKAENVFSNAQSAIDKCAKKNIIHKNKAAREKAKIAKAVKMMEGFKPAVKASDEAKK
ncbi:MAG: 30S ribosomal protein S20 [Candidatus Gracilibacteria bacterium]|jgi:small subunit ribosomal protein S20|nr:30S ribosomal protein S20 [Candidatus Gracilibacteria bacterium]